jgi:hypothetical protein
MKRLSGLMLLLGVAALVTAPALAQDNPEGPWPMVNGDHYGRARTTTPLLDWSQGMELAWTIDVNANPANIDITTARNAPVFDAAGNLYWLTSSGGLTGNQQWVVSATPSGAIRWRSQDALCIPGNGAGGVVVGANAVYAFAGGSAYDYDGDTTPGYAVAAFNKATGARIWLTDIDGNWTNDPANPSIIAVDMQSETQPLLYNGTLYIASKGSLGLWLTQVNAATGVVLHHDEIDPIDITGDALSGTLTLVPDVFAGDDGIFMNTGQWAPGQLVGIKLDSTSTPPGKATAAWPWVQLNQSQGRSHVIYSPVTKVLYVHTWNDNGSGFQTYDPVTGNLLDLSAQSEGNFGYIDVAALTWDDKTAAYGSFDGQIAMFEIDPANGMIVRPASPLYFGGIKQWGEMHYYGQLSRQTASPTDRGVMLTTGSRNNPDGCPGPNTTVFLADLNRATAAPANPDYFAGAYIDAVQVIGIDANNVETVVYADDFNTGWVLGAAVGQKPEWIDGGTAGPAIPEIADDPTGAGKGQVLKLDAIQPGTFPAIVLNFPVEVGPVNGYTKAKIRWQQYRADLNDELWIHPNGFRWGLESPYFGYILAIDAWWETPNTRAKLTKGVWQTVEIDIDQTDPTAAVERIYVDGVTDSCMTGAVANLPLFNSMYWDCTGKTWPPAFDPPALAVYDTGGADDLRSAVVGPDGKIYFQRSGNPRSLSALKPKVTVKKGDMNCDGVVDFKDINPFVAILSGATPCNAANADTNCDNVIDFKDINPFVALLSGGTPCQ